jgi:glycosidase
VAAPLSAYGRPTRHGVEKPGWWNSLYFSDQTWAGGVVFNFQSDPVRAFLIDNAKFFLDEYRSDGLRFDEVSVIDHNRRGWDFCQALTQTLRSQRPSALLHAEYWSVNSWIVKEREDANGAGFHTTMTDGPRIAIRDLLSAASIPVSQALPLTRVADQLGLNYLRDRWRGVNSLENHDLVMQPRLDRNSLYCFTLSSNFFSASEGGSNLPARYFARNSSEAALNAMRFSGRAKPCPSSGKT